MSKYINLIGQITERLDVPCGNIRLGIHEALAYLDRNPDQVPGRTITRTEYRDTLNHAVKTSGYGDDWERGFCTGLTVGGTKVVPDPEPTNAESISKLLTEFAELNASCGGEQGDHDLAEFLDARGVQVGRDD